MREDASMTERTPRRIQRKRTKGWRMPAHTVYVGRPTKWGNPFRVGQPNTDDYMIGTRAEIVAKYRSEILLFHGGFLGGIKVSDIRRELRGKNLCCWCPLDQPCHADVLLELANAV